MSGVKLISPVIVTELESRGGLDGTPMRIITQYWDAKGELLAEHDPKFKEIQAEAMTALINECEERCNREIGASCRERVSSPV